MSEEKSKHKYNPKSMENLRQYNVKGKKIVKDYEERFNKFITDNKILLSLETLNDLIPYNDIFKDKEIPQFFNILMLHLGDYAGEEELKVSDLNEIINICQLTILKYRLLKESSGKADLKDAVKFIESLDKTIEKTKTNLGSNRAARIDPRSRKAVTVVELIAGYESKQGRDKILSDIEKLIEEESATTGYSTSMDELIE